MAAGKWRRCWASVILACAWAVVHAAPGNLVEQLALEFFPDADRIEDFEGSPPAAPVFEDGRILGYVFFTDEVAAIPAYSGKPIRSLVGIDTGGKITGAAIVEHAEPILVTGVDEADLARFVRQYRGKDGTEAIKMDEAESEHTVTIHGLTGATITAMVLNASISRAARVVAASRNIPLEPEAPREEHAEGEDEAEAIEARDEAGDEAGVRERTATEAPARKQAESAAGGEQPALERGRPAGRAGGSGFEPESLWVGVWQERKPRIAVLGTGLLVLTAILVLQDWLVRRRTLVTWIRNGFLVYTLVFIGWYGLAQLSIVNVLTFTRAVMHDFRWETFLIEPMVFILWSFVAVTLLLWGRGVFCGWLCPYGALQELVNKLSLRLGVPQFSLPALIHERLLAIKYIILLALFGLSLQSMADAVRYAEVEPFKTAINMHFIREWPFVLYAAAFVVISAFNSKFFCKYVCPLGAALTIPGRFRIFDWWLRRRKECGHPCQICAVECPSQAIRPTGEINPNECHYCLECQITYWDYHKCPPLVEKRKRFEKHRREFKVKVG